MRREGLFALGVGCCVLLGAACTSTDDSSTASSPRVTIDMQDPRPLLTISGRSYIDESRLEIDTPNYNLFADGTLIVAFDDGTEPAAYSTKLSVGERDDLLSLADDSGLAGGGTQPSIAQPDDVGIIDGGDGVFVRRSGDEYTVRTVAQPDTASSTAPPERAAFVELFGNMRSHFSDATAGERLPLQRWAVVRTVPTEDDRHRELGDYNGPDVTAEKWEQIGGGDECAIVAMEHWPYSPAESVVARTLLEGRVVTRRPLLPHEKDCADVAEFRSVLGL